MKKVILVSLMMLAVTSLAFSQLFPTASQSAGGHKSTGEVIGNGSRSVPPGSLLYSNPFTCPPYDGLSSESWASSEVATDFVLANDANVNIVRSWFFLTADPTTTNWIIRIYSNQSCFPNSLLGTWNVSAADMNSELVCNAFGINIYDMWATLNPSFFAQAGQTYWVTVQAVIDSPNRAFWATSGTAGAYNDCQAAFRSTYFGHPTWITSFDEAGSTEFAMEIYVSQEVPVSNWALFIGIGLILVFAVVRFRRVI